MTKEDFFKMIQIKWAREKLFGSLDDWPKNKEVIAYLEKSKHPSWRVDRSYHIGYEWRADGIDVSYREMEGGGFGSMEEEHEVTRWFRLTYKEVFGWNVEWDKPAGTLKDVINIVTEILRKK
jgi:hypothetical protein